ncbi:10446_t:CDS:1 [Paraglomus brasilianum]|uniref:10446_t:CDS:1 n=1 Tax=Paraglomus brasilianum TaxID=144538 RepID=A0A9N9DRH2_9GLOM|nr:10446_t:CDS:1 [Paraglomus brasilianum]
MNNDSVRYYNNVQSSYPEDFFDDTHPPIQTPINLLAPIHTEDFHPPVTPDNVGITMNTMDYRNTGDHTSYQGDCSVSGPDNVDTMDGQLNTPCPPACYDQVETHTNSSCPFPISFQTFRGSSVPYPGTTNFQHHGMINNTSISYVLTQMPPQTPPQTSFSSNNSNVMNEPTHPGYAVTKVEYTQLGRISTADIDKILAIIRE